MKSIQSLMLLLLIGLPLGAVQASPDIDDVTMDVISDDNPDEVMHDIELPDDSDLEGRDEDHNDDDRHGPGHVDDDGHDNDDEYENEEEHEEEIENEIENEIEDEREDEPEDRGFEDDGTPRT